MIASVNIFRWSEAPRAPYIAAVERDCPAEMRERLTANGCAVFEQRDAGPPARDVEDRAHVKL